MNALIKAIYIWLHDFESLPQNVILTQINLQFNASHTQEAKLSLQARNALTIYTLKGSVFTNQNVAIVAKLIVTEDLPKGRMHFGRGGNFAFDHDEIHAFLKEAKDENPIHQGNLPIVPGLMLVNHYLKHMPKEEGILSVRFNHPLLAGTSFNYIMDEEKLTVESDELVIATITHQLGD